jgi:hypothetical protein
MALITTGDVVCRYRKKTKKWSGEHKMMLDAWGRQCCAPIGKYVDGKFKPNKNHGSSVNEHRCKRHKED